MANTTIQFKRTNVPTAVPNTTDPSNTQYIVAGELALNMADGILYTSNGSADGLIAVGSKQKTFQTTTVTVSDTFQIGDIATQMLKANSTTIFAGNTSTNLTVSTTTVSVQNTSTNSTITPNKIFVGNTATNAQFNLVGGSADLSIISFSYEASTALATFETDVPHNLVAPTKGTYVTLSNMTGAGGVFSGSYEVYDIVSATEFRILANSKYGGVIAPTNSVSRKNGYSKLVTTTNHGFPNGSQIIVSGAGNDYKDPLFTFDGTFTVVNTVAASNEIQYTQYPIITVSPSSMYKLVNDNFVTYKTSSPHNLQTNYFISTNAYPSGISTPITTRASVNAVAFAPLIVSGADRSSSAAAAGSVVNRQTQGGSIYMLVDSSDTNYKIFNATQTVPVTLNTDGGSSEDIYTRTVTSAFYDPLNLSKTGAVQYIVITLSQPLFAIGGGVILSGFTGSWAFLNDKQLPISQISAANYGKILSNGGYSSAPTYDLLKCYYITVSGIAAVSTIPNKTSLPFYNSTGASLTVRVPINMAALSTSTAAQMNVSGTNPPYLIRIDKTATAQDVTTNTSDTTWSAIGAFKNGLALGTFVPYSSVGWDYRGISTGVAKRITFTLGVDVSSFSVNQWCLLYGSFARNHPYSGVLVPSTGVGNIAGTNIGLYQITAVDTANKKITFDWTNGPLPYWNAWQDPFWRDHFYTSNITWNDFIIQPFVTTSSKVAITATMTRSINSQQPINSIINSTAFTMPLNSAENLNTTYGSYANPLPIIQGSFTRNTDIGIPTAPGGVVGSIGRAPKAPPATITYDATGSATGNCHIEYSSYVEVTNSTSAVRITPTTFYSGNTSTNLFSNSTTLAISSPTNAMQLGTGGFSVTGTVAGKYDPTKAHLIVNSSIVQLGDGTGRGTTIDSSGKIKNYGSEIDIGTEIANVFINEYSITINANDLQTSINATSSIFPGNVSIGGSLNVGGSYGDIGKVLSTDGTSLFWIDNGIDYTADQKFEANVAIAGTLAPSVVDIIDDFGNEVQSKASYSYYTANTLEQLVISANQIVLISNDLIANTSTINSTSITIGNASVNSTINSSSFTGTANNTLYVGSITATNVVSNAQLSGNLSNYQTTAGLSANVAKLTANAATYLNGNTASDLKSYSDTKAGDAYTNAVAKIATSTANNALYLGGYAADQYAFANAVVSVNVNSTYSWTNVHTFNNTVIITKGLTANGSNGTAGQVLMTAGTGGNVYWETVGSGGVGSVTSVGSGNGLTGGPITSNGTLSVLANTGIIANTSGVFIDPSYIGSSSSNNAFYLNGNTAADLRNYSDSKAATAYSNAIAYSGNAALAYSNATSYADSKAATAYSNAVAAIAVSTANNTLYLGGYAADQYAFANSASGNAAQAYANAIAYSGNSALAYSNAVSYVDGKSYVNTSQLSSNLSNYALKSGTTFTGDITTNNLTVSGNLTIAGNTTIIGANNLVVLDAVLSLHTQANLAPWSSSDGRIIGIAYHYYNSGDKQALLSINQSNAMLTYYDTSTDAILGDPSGTTIGNIQANTFYAGNNTVYATVNATNYSGTANNASYLGGVAAASYVTTTNLTNNLTNYATTTSVTANAATAYSNAVSYITGLGYLTAISGSGNVAYDSSRLGGTLAASFVQNTDSRTLSGNLNFTGTNTYFTGKATYAGNLVIASGASIIDSAGGQGTPGQVLTSNGSGNVYWSTVTSSGGSSNIVRQKYTADGISNTFTVSGGYTANTLDVYMNGIKLQTNVEANVQSGSTFTILGDTPTVGAVIEVIGLVGTPTVDYTKYVKTFNITGNFSAPVTGVARYIPLTNTTITTIRMTNGSNIVGADLIAQIYKNDSLNSTYTLTAGNYTRLYTNAAITLTTSDYLTVNISQGVGNNFSLTISN